MKSGGRYLRRLWLKNATKELKTTRTYPERPSMRFRDSEISRRHLLKGLAFATAASLTPGLWAEELAITPKMTEGPFYPDKLPLDTDNDLIIVNDSVSPALGEVTHLTGRILSRSGEPVRNAFVEIWQVDHNGVYLNTHDRNGTRDSNFQGYGRFLTDSTGHYYFRTIKPVPYPGRTPHIHFGVSRNGSRIYTTQLFVNGHAQNEGDGILQDLDEGGRRRVLVDFNPLPNSRIGELTADFDIVMGVTPADKDAEIKGGIGHAEGHGGPGGPRGGGPGGPRRRPPRQRPGDDASG
jgi:protocatechuate 3,4-dioxygenase beta subunit